MKDLNDLIGKLNPQSVKDFHSVMNFPKKGKGLRKKKVEIYRFLVSILQKEVEVQIQKEKRTSILEDSTNELEIAPISDVPNSEEPNKKKQVWSILKYFVSPIIAAFIGTILGLSFK